MLKHLLIGLALLTPVQADQYKVIGISDGDTINVLIDKKQLKIRLAQIDAPESRQAFGAASKQALSELIYNKNVSIETETVDRYGRTVATVLHAGIDINLEMVRRGMAWVYTQYAHDINYFEAQAEASKNGVGLWSDSQPIAPWEWRRGGRAEGEVANIKAHKRSKIYHLPHCKSYNRIAQRNTVIFEKESDAIDAGFRLARNC